MNLINPFDSIEYRPQTAQPIDNKTAVVLPVSVEYFNRRLHELALINFRGAQDTLAIRRALGGETATDRALFCKALDRLWDAQQALRGAIN